MNLSVMNFLQSFFHGCGTLFFSVDQVYFSLPAARGAEVMQQLVMVGMPGERIQRFDARSHRKEVAEDADFLRSAHDASPERVSGAVAHKDNGVVRAGDAVFEVVEDATGFTHAGGGDDDGSLVHVVEFL